TLAGLLMFGQESSILEAFPHFHLDYQEKLSDDKDVRWNYRITTDGTWECNLFNFYYRAYNRLIQDIEVPFALDKDGTRVGETHVHEALREALVNSLVHANYYSTKSIKIIKAVDHFTFMNPGRLRIPIEQIYQGGVSDARNPYIQRMFQFLGLGEKAGSGFEKILRAWKEQSWLMPLVSEKIDLDVTLVLLPFLSMVPEKVNEELSHLIGEDYKQLNELERLILTLAHQFESINNQEISRYTKTHSKDIGDELKKMVNRGWLVPGGVGKGRTYKLNLDFKKQSLQHLDPSLQHSSTIEEVRNSKKSSKALVIKAILEACNNRFVSAIELSTLLNRSVESLRNHYLGKMVKEGLLKTKYDELSHPDQAYTKVNS
ncbi:MAG: ATP-binding protein, partial [Sulfurovum sp.]